jgi:hypothetical protein
MPLSSSKALEVFSAELACDVPEIIIGRFPAFEVRCHVVDFVNSETLPIFAIHITLLAIEMLRVVLFVVLHLQQRVEAVLAPLHSTGERLLLASDASALATSCAGRRFGHGRWWIRRHLHRMRMLLGILS